MPEQLINLLWQLPVVAVFVWYSDRLLTRFESMIVEERKSREKQAELFTAAIAASTAKIDAVQDSLTRAVAVMEERTRTRKPPDKE